MDKKQSFIDYLLVCYYDEVFGVSLFENLENSSSGISEKNKWRALRNLEIVTKKEIKAVLNDFSVDTISETEQENISKGVLLAKELELKPWLKLMSDLSLEIEPYLQKYRDAKVFSDLDKFGIIDFIIAHEEAIYYFTNKEKNKSIDDSLIMVNKIIKN